MGKMNNEQIVASKADTGVNLVIAGAGTGKTTAMIEKIKNVISHSIAKPDEILVLTFSKKASEEIKERLVSGNNFCSELITVGTFHSFALSLLRENSEQYLKYIGFKSFPSIIETEKKEIIMKQLILQRRENFIGLPVGAVVKLTDNFDHLSEPVIEKLKSCSLFDELTSLRTLYEKYKKDNQIIEFEDMINHSSLMLEHNPEFKKTVTKKFSYIFVDEFQDTSENNFLFLSLLIPDNDKNLFMVGDDFQSIYKFRHSRVEYIINAEKFFPEISIHKLTVNYRSKKEIINISNRFISLNRFRTKKKIISHRGKGGKIRFHSIEDMYDEAEEVIRIIRSIPESYSVAVLYRNNYQGTFLESRYSTENIKKNIKFITMHGSKGLEFDAVIIAGISDKIIPDRTSDIEEERRLFYVALTRAKDELHLLYYNNSSGELPRFIRETGYKKG